MKNENTKYISEYADQGKREKRETNMTDFSSSSDESCNSETRLSRLSKHSSKLSSASRYEESIKHFPAVLQRPEGGAYIYDINIKTLNTAGVVSSDTVKTSNDPTAPSYMEMHVIRSDDDYIAASGTLIFTIVYAYLIFGISYKIF